MTQALRFGSVALRDFRNLAVLDFEPAPRLNVVSGDNGQGKTSLVEALYVVATSRSFRADKLGELIRDGAETAIVRAVIVDAGLEREQRAVIAARSRGFFVDGKRAPRAASYATQTPVVAFHPGDLALVSGAATHRRTLLDRVALHVDPPSLEARANYLRASKERQRALTERGPGARELDAFEALMAEHGARLQLARGRAATRLIEALGPAFERMAARGLVLDARFAPGGSEDLTAMLVELAARRPQDARRGSASFGPQRDELELAIDGRSARHHASQGQQRVLTLALKAAELACVREASGRHPVLLLDDVSSELDPTRTGAVHDFVRDTKSQVFVTTTRPELFVTPRERAADRVDFRLAGGSLVVARTG